MYMLQQAHVVFEDKKSSNSLLQWLCTGIHKAEHDTQRPYFELLGPVLQLEDDLQVRPSLANFFKLTSEHVCERRVFDPF